MEMYKEAVKLKLRFLTSKGTLTIEQLWDLSQSEIALAIKNVKKSLKKNDDDELSFLEDNTSIDTVEQLRFDILKDVYLTKKKEFEALREAKNIKEHNQKILQLISEKKEGELQTKSIAELEALLK